MRWDIFCQIVDNYGDAGVCWRLARSLSSRDDIRIRLFCDDLDVLNKIAYGDAIKAGSSLGIEVLPWSLAQDLSALKELGTSDVVADVVIEAFACHIPEVYIDAMRLKAITALSKPLWINLEYLTAESWADEMHLLPSPQNNGLDKYFYFPGFTEKTGGVVLGDWDAVTSQSVPASLLPYWHESPELDQSMLRRVSIFNYSHAPLEQWLMNLAAVANSHGELIDIYACANQNISNEFIESLKDSPLRIIQLPFIPQEDYDWLLSRCDLNLVRGEDSFVRAQWAGKPFIWDIYPQSDQAHEVKLEAFLDLYFKSASSSLIKQGKTAMKWSDPHEWWGLMAEWTVHSANWSDKLRALGQLEVKILDFVKSQEMSR
jgi:uncharacterized repeat protein (TIGR03837 family)